MINSKALAEHLNGEHLGTPSSVARIVQYKSGDFREDTLTWLSDKNFHLFSKDLNGVLITSRNFNLYDDQCSFTLIKVDNPRMAFMKAIDLIYPPKRHPSKTESTAVVADTAVIGQDCYIGHHVVIGENVRIGKNTVVLHNTVIEDNTVIGDHCNIGTNVSIGGEGFGYEKDENGRYLVIRHVGNVEIHDYVDIGNNVCIDRGVTGSTVIKSNVKIDNLVHISHGVTIGANSLIIAFAMLGGSSTIGENVWVAPSSAIMNQKSVGDNALVGMGAVVVKDVAAATTVAGNPAKVLPPKNQS
jgi:UDP-3-O-[3-hydroxymyristoyl] glucosamine N-acyltransferase